MSNSAQYKTSVLQRIAYIEECNKLMGESLPSLQPRTAAMTMKGDLPIDKDALNAAILNSGIIGFDPGMTKRNKRITKNCFQYADLKALMEFPRETQKEQRFHAFTRTMRACGWMFWKDPYTRYNASAKTLTMDNIALDIIQTVVAGSTGVGVAPALNKAAQATMKALKDHPAALKLFEANAKKADGGNFAITTCQQDHEGEVTLAVAAIQYSCRVPSTKVLFWEYATTDVEIWEGQCAMTIEEEDYLPVEALVNKGLAAMRQKLIEMEFSPAA